MFGVIVSKRVLEKALDMGEFLDSVFFDSQHRFVTSEDMLNEPEEAFRLIF